MKTKRIITIMTAIIILFTINVNVASAKSKPVNNQTIAVKYCKKHYKNYKVKIVNEYKVPKYRKSKRIIYVERVKSISRGKYGITKDGYYIGYNKPVKKNKRHVVYLVYNPKSNYTDDVVAVISNGKVR